MNGFNPSISCRPIIPLFLPLPPPLTCHAKMRESDGNNSCLPATTANGYNGSPSIYRKVVKIGTAYCAKTILSVKIYRRRILSIRNCRSFLLSLSTSQSCGEKTLLMQRSWDLLCIELSLNTGQISNFTANIYLYFINLYHNIINFIITK